MQVTDCTVKNTSSGASDPEALFRTLQAAKTEIDTLRQQLCQARQQLDWFKRQLFGRKSEKRIIDNPHQLDLGELLGDTPVPAEPEPEEITVSAQESTPDPVQTFSPNPTTEEKAMDTSDITEGAPFWQPHISAWQQSGLTQKAYCEQQELRYSTFGYWVRKLRRAAEPATEKKGAGFVPVIPATVQPAGLILSLPNGLEIRGIATETLPLVKQLLAVL